MQCKNNRVVTQYNRFGVSYSDEFTRKCGGLGAYMLLTCDKYKATLSDMAICTNLKLRLFIPAMTVLDNVDCPWSHRYISLQLVTEVLF